MKPRAFQARVLALILAALIAEPGWLAAAAQQQLQLPDPGSASGITKQEQEQAGLQAIAEVYKEMPALPDSSPVTQYVQQLGEGWSKSRLSHSLWYKNSVWSISVTKDTPALHPAAELTS